MSAWRDLREYLRDMTGINRYVIRWKLPHGQGAFGGQSGMHCSYRTAKRVVRKMNDEYGKGTHWAERSTIRSR